MSALRSPYLPIVAGALLCMALALAASRMNGAAMADDLAARAELAIAEARGAPVIAHFRTEGGLPTRHPLLSGGEELNEATRARIANVVAAIPGAGGIRWTDGSALAESSAAPIRPLHCQNEVEALLRARTIRFEESSTRIDAASQQLLDEVAAALRPCLGSIIAITGHTDSSGPEPGNLALSADRAEAVRLALMNRGIPADGLRVRGMGSSDPVEGLDPTDPANRRIEFSVIATEAIVPTPVDTPGPR
ncbi:OOP family OmpA-OmpF porin [Altererythrobacter atlanticus]|uniref:Outer membrane protein A n=1 Tax=Croceibacterium atlanticum TaxID=1267766 RepID=A0A0F7KX45_9SPHN|nr:OmpA family protein [Croceibacterium atlanticum]AKH44249.1 Outer membrane protein A precursor [Croceibacterium atlanticum]MBB5732560.1 OOP family OmpA-OmpF porin [Croceibacterium atlanticum]